jgi:aminoethylphosphonate catabolism LysR family transcriptional regulator
MLYTQLRSFNAVTSEGGFTAASRALKIGQPTITHQVKELEALFGVELFHRRGRRVEPTDAGRALFALTQRMMSLEAEAADLLNALGGLRIGHLRVGAVGPYHVTEMLSAFSERFPDLKLSVTIGNSKAVLESLVEFRTDIAVLAHIEDEPTFYAKPYSRHPVVVFINVDHPWAGRKSIRIAELQDQRMVLRETGSTTRRAFEEAIRQARVTVNPVMEIGSREAVWMAVERGIGIGVVSDIEFIPHPRLRVLRVADAEIFTYAHVVCLSERKDAPVIRAFLEVVEQLLVRKRPR